MQRDCHTAPPVEKETMTLKLEEVPVETLEAIARVGREMNPPVRRNDYIRHVLEKLGEGKVRISDDEGRAA